MIIPVKKFTTVTLADNARKLIDALGRLGVIQLRKLDESEFAGFKEIVSEEAKEYENLYEKLNLLKNRLNDSLKKPETIEFTKIKPSIEELKSSIEDFEKRTVELEEKIKSVKEQLKTLNESKPILQILKTQKINPGDIGEFKHIFAKAGIAKTKLLPSLRLRLKPRKEITFREAASSLEETFLYITGLIELKDWIEKLLTIVEFKEFKLPSGIPNEITEAIKWVEEEAKKLENELKILEEKWFSLKQEFEEKAGYLEVVVGYGLDVCLAEGNLLRSRLMVVLQGWVPVNKIEALNNYLDGFNRMVGGSVFYVYDDPLPGEDVPTVMENPKLFKAYEVLTRQYGYPSHEETDPTIVSTILWVTMFGIMFPDFGQGLIILGLGLLFSFVLKRNVMGLNFAKLGKLMIGLGFSAVIFGLLAGEFFLLEVKPLWPGLIPGWVKTPSNVVWLIKIAVFFGIAQIILALALSIKNYLRAGDWLEALLGEKGLAGLLTFIGIALIALNFLGITVIPRLLSFPELKMNVLKHWSLALTIVGIILIALKPIIAREGATMSLGVLIETLISSLANMLSYARIAGFCIAHAAFALVVAELMHANPALGIGLGLIFLNIFSLTLELMVVMIQALRLLYYEFSTKFFKGTGKPYTPYKIKTFKN
jgi:V/A-type H+-transporting ATPase subunit I